MVIAYAIATSTRIFVPASVAWYFSCTYSSTLSSSIPRFPSVFVAGEDVDVEGDVEGVSIAIPVPGLSITSAPIPVVVDIVVGGVKPNHPFRPKYRPNLSTPSLTHLPFTQASGNHPA